MDIQTQIIRPLRDLSKQQVTLAANALTDAASDLAQAHALLPQVPAASRQLIKDMQTATLSTADMSNQLKVMQQWLNGVHEQMQTTPAMNDREALLTRALVSMDTALAAENKKLNPQTHDFVRSFKQNLRSVYAELNMRMEQEESDGDEDDMMLVAEKETFLCPITQRPFENPVSSVQCKHVYSKAAIEALLRSNAVIPCPISGCNQMVSKTDLKVDKTVQRKMKRHEFSQVVSSSSKY